MILILLASEDCLVGSDSWDNFHSLVLWFQVAGGKVWRSAELNEDVCFMFHILQVFFVAPTLTSTERVSWVEAPALWRDSPKG